MVRIFQGIDQDIGQDTPGYWSGYWSGYSRVLVRILVRILQGIGQALGHYYYSTAVAVALKKNVKERSTMPIIRFTLGFYSEGIQSNKAEKPHNIAVMSDSLVNSKNYV